MFLWRYGPEYKAKQLQKVPQAHTSQRIEPLQKPGPIVSRQEATLQSSPKAPVPVGSVTEGFDDKALGEGSERKL